MLTEELDIRRVASALSPSQLAELREAEDGLPARIDHEHPRRTPKRPSLGRYPERPPPVHGRRGSLLTFRGVYN